MSKGRSALYELTLARTREFLRTPEALFWVFAFPILLALGVGFAFREKAPDRVPVAVVASGGRTDFVVRALRSSRGLGPRLLPGNEAMAELRTGRVALLVEPGPPVVYRYDPTRPESRSARLEADAAIQQAAGRRNVLPTRDGAVREQGSRYIDFLVPSLLGLNLMGTGMWSIGFSIVNARVRKLLKRLVATPMRRSDYLLAQILSRLVFLVFEVTALIAFGWIVFGVAVHGSIALVAVLCLVGAMTFSGLALLVASRVETLEGVNGLMNVVMMPMWILSGVFFSWERFPEILHPFIRALPLTALNDSLREVINRGAGLSQVAPEIAIMAAWGIASFALALRIFRWR